jgi:hypothetical protein
MTLHLTHEQLCDLIFADLSPKPYSDSVLSFDRKHTPAVVEDHLRACLLCSAELKSLRDSLTLYRDASTAYACQEFAHTHIQWSSIAPAPHRYLSQPLYWAAAALTIVAALFPLSLHRQQASPAPANAALTSPQSVGSQTAVASATESDEDLLADIDQKVAADVPSPLEPLADPTATAAATSSTSEQRKN